jgi:[acyl-carrier-protein] S-malonyltransferase
MKRVAFMFPGQGSQKVGMAQEFYEHFPAVKQQFEKADELLDKSMTEIMFEGPKERLTATENAQPALLLSSIVIHHLLAAEQIKPVMTIGHSLGEYSALVAAGALSLDQALPLVSTRGKLMEEAFPEGQGTMAAVLGLSEPEIDKALTEIKDEVVDKANINCPGQIVISGSKKGMEQASAILKEHGAKRVLPLNVSGPFHSRLMKAANTAFAAHLKDANIQDAVIPVYANVSAEPVTKREDIEALLVKQLYSPVQFEASIRHMIEQGVDAFVEIGSGKVLCGLVKKIDRNVKSFAIQDIASMNDFMSWYKEVES